MVITLNSEKNASSRRLLLPPSLPTAPRILNPESVYLLFWIAESSRSVFGIGETSVGVSGAGEACWSASAGAAGAIFLLLLEFF